MRCAERGRAQGVPLEQPHSPGSGEGEGEGEVRVGVRASTEQLHSPAFVQAAVVRVAAAEGEHAAVEGLTSEGSGHGRSWKVWKVMEGQEGRGRPWKAVTSWKAGKAVGGHGSTSPRGSQQQPSAVLLEHIEGAVPASIASPAGRRRASRGEGRGAGSGWVGVQGGGVRLWREG